MVAVVEGECLKFYERSKISSIKLFDMSYALITGASRGIGKAIAEELAGRHYNLILTGRYMDELYAFSRVLEKRYPIEVLPIQIDLSHADAAEQLTALTAPYHHDLSVLVNNAGYGLNGAFETISINDQLDIIDVNIKALVKISYAYIPVLKQSKKAYLLNVSSTTAYQPIPYFNVYAATKAFVLSFTRGLRHELRKSNLSVSCLCPGSTDTNFVNRAGMSDATKKLAAQYNMSPEAVARIAVSGLFRGKSEIVPGFINKLTAILPKFLPKHTLEKIAGKIYEQKGKWNSPALENILA